MVVVTSLRVIVANQVDFAFGFPYAIYVMTTEKKKSRQHTPIRNSIETENFKWNE